ncbi:ArsR/SmtB family transcription factor [Streptomyces scopuliridis]|uniref:ArsR/SmtB family transcription factor n=1 Tax=Streptomyces scopuliridis TaxID=452529 RepID=UPI0035D5DFBA
MLIIMGNPDPVQTELTDPRAMRALAHPLRLVLLRMLSEGGPATATQLATQAGVSVASAGYHLGQLAKYGFTEDASPGRKGRERPWRARVQGVRWAAGSGDPAFAAASRLLRGELIDHALSALSAYHRTEQQYPAEWQEAAYVLADAAHLTAEELREINAELSRLFARYRGRPADSRPPGAVPVRLFGFGVPEAMPPASTLEESHDDDSRDITSA